MYNFLGVSLSLIIREEKLIQLTAKKGFERKVSWLLNQNYRKKALSENLYIKKWFVPGEPGEPGEPENCGRGGGYQSNI